MPSFSVHQSDAEPFIKRFGQPVEATPTPTSVVLRYAEMEEGEAEEAREVSHRAQEAREALGIQFSRSLLRFSNGILTLDAPALAEAQPTAGSLDDIPFTSPTARRAAEEAGLTASDFAGEEPSGKTGFTKKDVEAIAA